MSDLTREGIEGMKGLVILEFGATWCPYCQVVREPVSRLLLNRPEVQHLSIEDGRGKPLGRSYNVKWWPTFVFIRDGEIIARLERPSEEDLAQAFSRLDPQVPPTLDSTAQ
jgi:thioredoxin 1